MCTLKVAKNMTGHGVHTGAPKPLHAALLCPEKALQGSRKVTPTNDVGPFYFGSEKVDKIKDEMAAREHDPGRCFPMLRLLSDPRSERKES